MTRRLSLHGVINMHTDTPGQHASRREALRVLTDEHMTGKVQPLLHEIRYALVHLSKLGETTVIDLRNFSQPYQSTQEFKGRA